MNIPTILSRLQFGFTVGYHYLFPQITMGLALLLVILKILYRRTKDERYNHAVHFWVKIFAIVFIMGAVTGIPLEFQFGTNWSRFSAYAGNIIAQTLAMEGAFAFFLESAFLGVFLFGEQRFGQTIHLLSAIMVWIGTWASAAFIIATNAWMQHPVGYTITKNGQAQLTNYWAVIFNPWILPQYLHTMSGTVTTAAFLMAGLGAFYLLSNKHIEFGRMFVTIGVLVGLIVTIIQIFPTGDMEGTQVTHYQPAKLAAMEGLFNTERGAGIIILGQPDPESQRIDNPIIVPKILSFLTYRRWTATVTGLKDIPKDQWPDSISLLYYSYHIMVGLGTIFVAIMGLAFLLWWNKRRLFNTRWMLWTLMLAAPFPIIANTFGWFTTEVGRQPWIAFGLLRTAQGNSPLVSSGNIWFTLLGFLGIYSLLGLLCIILVVHEIIRGPAVQVEPGRQQETANVDGIY
ncbi:MAG TPA: cytochrome ubiquinol oxidase subunit I [Ktedonobacteraceae bacterium]|jgi:cytochrome d ubiquinol oxidase subunit I|nr:cytochrome ubiquinol oxidase subunit I [Ktedonobacteraceae bacterium]